MKHSTTKKAVKSKNGIYANGRIWTPEQYDRFRKYQVAFTKKHYRTFAIRFARDTDADIIEYLEKQDNVVEYLRKIIRADNKKNKKKDK